jgi:hypothetical protein
MPLAGRAVAAPPDAALDHAMLAARARILSNPGVDALRSAVAEARGCQPGRAAGSAPGRCAVCRSAGVGTPARVRAGPHAAGPPGHAERGGTLRRPSGQPAGGRNRLAGRPQPVSPLPGAGRPELLLNTQITAADRACRRGQCTACRPGWRAIRATPAPGRHCPVSAPRWGSRPCGRSGPRPRCRWPGWTTAPRNGPVQGRTEPGAAGGGAGQDHIEASIIDTRTRQVELLASGTGARALIQSPAPAPNRSASPAARPGSR